MASQKTMTSGFSSKRAHLLYMRGKWISDDDVDKLLAALPQLPSGTEVPTDEEVDQILESLEE